jgi:beta-lactamase class A
MIRRPRRLALIVVGTAVFLVLSGILAGWLSLEGVERNDILSLLNAEARGDAPAMLAQLSHCDARCRSYVRSDARRLRRTGRVLILADQSATAYALTSTTGDTRVAWQAGKSLPIVQCVTVSRTGNALSGLTLRLVAVGGQIPSQSDCARRYDG